MSELYTAITLDQTEVVKTILAHDHCHVNRIDKNGDQPAHLAARLNRIECIKILIEHDARMGRKNFNNLTPLGEAQMNGHTEIVSLIKDNYTTNASQEHWNDEINRECSTWGLYSKLVEFMNQRGVDNAFVLYSYAIFCAVTNEEDWDEIKDYTSRAKIAEELAQKRKQVNCGDRGEPTKSYKIADVAFYMQAVRDEVDVAESWHNYALCQMLVCDYLKGARKSFRQALIASPHNRRVISNFNSLLQDADYLGPEKSAYDEYLSL
eukprot:g10071.t1 g10071   contig4:1162765-1164916(-)